MPEFSHLHVHSQFSLLDGAASIEGLVAKAKAEDMKAIALTDHGNMFGAFKFVAEAAAKGVKPIVGCEFYMVENRHKKSFTKEARDIRSHQLLLAKNPEGYKNLVKLCSLGYMEGLYGKYPRIDKELLVKYHKGLIATSCCLAAIIPRTILRHGEAEAEKELKWWLDLFGEDFYIELQRHDIPEQNTVNLVLLALAAKYGIKVIASNDSHYVDKQDANAHDILLCINTGEKQSTPTNKDFDDDASSKGKRFAFYNNEFYFKNKQEMSVLFKDVPQALDNTQEIVDKVEMLKLKQDILLPNFVIPTTFLNQDDYLRHMTYEGARVKYKDITTEIEERLNFELHVIKTMGFAGYFLIVADFIKHGRDIGVFIGPGRGSAAGSAVAYSTGITNIDPIKYNLLFERFLNPDRKSMPDIDTDFDDEGRQKVIDYVVDKYGKNQVAQIITYGTMAAKMSIKDVARVLDLPLQEANTLAKLVPDRPGISLRRVLTAPIDGDKSLKDKEGLGGEELDGVRELRRILAEEHTDQGKVLKEAMILEGSVRGTGIHAAGIIIAPTDLTDLIPVAVAKDSDLLVTQYDGRVIEDAGVIKMDFLGLKTLTILRDALKLIKENHGIEIVIDDIPLDDIKTLELYQRGDTNGTFQFESAGMQKYLRELKPDKFEDLIAMNALYRPGPLEYIPLFIERKHGRKKVEYDLSAMEELLADTYGITVYQEQVMLLSQKLANFTKGDADVLRKAMGKKDKKTLDKLKPQFIENASLNGHDAKVLEKVWTDWEAFASYAFNKSHSTCYAFVAFQTAYLKAHYPSEYMASVLTHNLNNIDKVTFFMEECKRMGLEVLGPDVNESSYQFSVNQRGQVRFGLGAVKGVGEGAVIALVEERKEKGLFKDIFDVTRRINLKAANRKTFEAMALSGAFDCFEGVHRAQYFHVHDKDNMSLIEKAIRYGNNWQSEQNTPQVSLFGGGENTEIVAPRIPTCEPWSDIEKLKREKEIVGFYISGHPLDLFRLEIDNFCTCSLEKVMDMKDREVQIGGIVSAIKNGQAKNGNNYIIFSIEDYQGSLEIALFGKDHASFSNYIHPGQFLFIRGAVKNRFGQPDSWRFTPTYMELLSEIRAKFCKGIKLKINTQKLTSQLVNQLEETFIAHKGASNVYFQIFDTDERISTESFSRKYKIDPNNTLLNTLGEMAGIEYKILS
ncbi:MAG: DNA polymerase III subunit alpha [Cytophagaceae bacterium]|nr:DNA polymerase III subunit alpha [Cytophagaceae bacterium]